MSLDAWIKVPDLPEGWSLELEYRGTTVRWLLSNDKLLEVYDEGIPISLTNSTRDFVEMLTDTKKQMVYKALAMDKNMKAAREV
jgi:hypothetical protein